MLSEWNVTDYLIEVSYLDNLTCKHIRLRFHIPAFTFGGILLFSHYIRAIKSKIYETYNVSSGHKPAVVLILLFVYQTWHLM